MPKELLLILSLAIIVCIMHNKKTKLGKNIESLVIYLAIVLIFVCLVYLLVSFLS